MRREQVLRQEVLAAQAGSAVAFTALVRRYQDMAYATALSRLGHVQQAEDAAQEAFVEAFVGLPRLQTPEAFTSWFQVLLSRSIARVRSRTWYTSPLVPELATVNPTPYADLRLEVAAALSTLPAPQREAVILHYLGGYSAPELAQQLALPLTTVKKRLADARRTLRTRMEPLMENTIQQAAPSANDQFTHGVLRLIQPDSLKSEQFVAWSGGIGTEIWSLFRAAMTGDLTAAKGLLAKDPALIHASCDYRTPLHFAVRENQPALVALFLDAGANTCLQVGGVSPLALARERGYQEVLALLEAHHARIPNQDERGNQPIHWAVMRRDLAQIDLLLDAGADINARRPDGARPLDLTNGDYFFRGRRDVPTSAPSPEAIADHLLARGAFYDLPNAAKRGDLVRVQALLDAGESPWRHTSDYCTYGAGTPLRNAAQSGHLAVVELLLAHGADPNEPEPGIAPFGGALYAAAAGGHIAIARLLLEHGASPNQAMESSGSAMSRAKGNKDHAMVALLASYGGISGFAISCYYNELEIVAAMLSVDPALADNAEALGYAVSEGHVALTRLLLRHAPQTAAKLSGAQASTVELLELLLQHGLDPNFTNWLGVTALHDLAAAGDIERAALLIAHGARLDAVDEEYRATPRGWAERAGKTELLALLTP